ncbi:PDZ domain-containing protein [Virgibacillus oceani]|uniref:Membrane protein n=1 Tax=Virgibacillus oceani TaxID=1479511 RepID=A0A917H4U8_9BACI|nr:PDZ domain-containing protein [Virgibacillus oceani]GGG67267.1 membrane protein [Virgibacillus oceani]
METWLIELANGIGKMFLNPLLYWAIILVVLVGAKRIKNERNNFGLKVFDIFSEWKGTWAISLVTGLILSLFSLGIGLVFSYETVLLLSIVIILLSIIIRFTMLSASYTIGATYLILLFMPFILENQSFTDNNLFSTTNFTGLTILLGLFLIVEAIVMVRVTRNETYPQVGLGQRGKWIGQHHLKRACIIPFFVLIPTGTISSFAPFWPYFSLGGETYSLLLIPFLIGFDHVVKGNLPQIAGRRIARSISILGVIVLLLSIGSIFVSWLSLIASIIAILGREYISYRHRVYDKERSPYFYTNEKGVKVLAVIPGTPADRLNILVGETIIKVNGIKINAVSEFYQALQASKASFKLELLDDSGEVRFLQSALYQGDHHELGIIFSDNQYSKEPIHAGSLG